MKESHSGGAECEPLTNEGLPVLAEAIRMARFDAGLTHFDLARRVGVLPSTIRRFESGALVPNVVELLRIGELARGVAKTAIVERLHEELQGCSLVKVVA